MLIQWGREQTYQQVVLEKLDIHMQKNDVQLLPYKINSNWIKDLNICTKTIKSLEENIKENLHDIGFGNGFFAMPPKAQAINDKINKLD